MSTECTRDELRFEAPGRRELVARFDGGELTSDAGILLLKVTDESVDLLGRFARCFRDFRDPSRVQHPVVELARQRVYGLALGYEDLVDHDELRDDRLLASAVGKVIEPKSETPMAGSCTLSRLERSCPETASGDRYARVSLDHDAVDDLLIDVFIESQRRAPKQIVIDLDATDDPLHGGQEGRFFHGHYGHYCYLPLYIFCGDHLLCARLRPSNIDGSKGSAEELDRIVTRIRERWPKVRIILRADSGFCRDGLMSWCEANAVDYVLGLARNPRLVEKIEEDLERAKRRFDKEGKPARVFRGLRYRTRDSWRRSRRVVAKAEWIRDRANPRFVVTSLEIKDWGNKELYEKLYCARGDMENRIKEQQLYLFADRTSSHTMRANQNRLYFSSIAYVLLNALRRIALSGTELASAQCHTIRLKLLKVAARVKVTARKIWVHLSTSYPRKELWTHVVGRIRAG